MEILDQFSAAGNLWVAVIKQAKKDLVLGNTRNALIAARYFFLEPVDSDFRDIKTFAGLCAATRINVDAAAKAIFTELKPNQQERILNLLKNDGYTRIRPEVII